MTRSWPADADVNPEVEAELERLPATPIIQLRKRYRELFRAEPPKAFGPDLLRRSIAHRIQEKAYGGLPAATQRLLDQLVKVAAVKPDARLELPRRIKPGSELVRTWNRRTYRVMVLCLWRQDFCQPVRDRHFDHRDQMEWTPVLRSEIHQLSGWRRRPCRLSQPDR
jgi:hypothetical protein